MGGFVVTECGRRKSKFMDIQMGFSNWSSSLKEINPKLVAAN